MTIQDDAPVEIGDDCNFGPNVTIVTPLHPLVPRERKSIKTSKGDKKALCYAKSVKIGNNCWICANVTICPGVTIGDNCVIGAGSVVTRDIEPDSLAAGVPCRILRKISEHDSLKYKPRRQRNGNIKKERSKKKTGKRKKKKRKSGRGMERKKIGFFDIVIATLS